MSTTARKSHATHTRPSARAVGAFLRPSALLHTLPKTTVPTVAPQRGNEPIPGSYNPALTTIWGWFRTKAS